MICGAYNKSKKSPCTAKGKEKYDGRCGNHRERNKFDCDICMDPISCSEKIEFTCGHFMCMDCWIGTLVSSSTQKCPMCRGDAYNITIPKRDEKKFNEKLDSCERERREAYEQKISIFNRDTNLAQQEWDIVNSNVNTSMEDLDEMEELYLNIINRRIELQNEPIVFTDGYYAIKEAYRTAICKI